MVHTNVVKTFRRDCYARDIPWPVERNVTRFESQRRGLNESYLIASFAVAEVVREYMTEHGMTYDAFVKHSGIPRRTVADLINDSYGKVRKPTAIRFLRACGEDVAGSLESWRPRKVTNLRSSNPNEPAKRTAVNADNVLDDWEFLRSCGWTNMAQIANKIGLSYGALEILIRRHKDDPRVGNLKYVERYTRTALDAA
jgi:hypothetical protein